MKLAKRGIRMDMSHGLNLQTNKQTNKKLYTQTHSGQNHMHYDNLASQAGRNYYFLYLINQETSA